MEQFLQTNVYSFRGTVLICGSCLPTVAPEAVRALSAEADQVYALCLEESHLNLAVTKLTAILGTGQVRRILFATVDRSPHCTQMHYMKHEIERVLPRHIPMESFVVVDGKPIPVDDEAVELSKTLSRLTAMTGTSRPSDH